MTAVQAMQHKYVFLTLKYAPAYLHKHTVHTLRYEINMTDTGGHNYHV